MIKKELTYNNAKIQTQNIETTTQTPYIMKNYININKTCKTWTHHVLKSQITFEITKVDLRS